LGRGAAKLLAIPLAAGILAAAVALAAAGAGLAGSASPACATTVTAGMEAAGVALGPVQVANARIIYDVGVGLRLPPRAEIIAIATAMQESGLVNLPYGTGDSLGLFQQQPIDGWGTVAQVMDPVTSARAFYESLVRVPYWQTLPVTVAAQAVQRSAFPGAYAQWQPVATTLVASFDGDVPAGLLAAC